MHAIALIYQQQNTVKICTDSKIWCKSMCSRGRIGRYQEEHASNTSALHLWACCSYTVLQKSKDGRKIVGMNTLGTDRSLVDVHKIISVKNWVKTHSAFYRDLDHVWAFLSNNSPFSSALDRRSVLAYT